MKKLLTLICAVTFASAVWGQAGIHFGAQGAFNSTWIMNQNNYGFQELDYSRTFGYSGGASFGYNFSQTLGLQFDLMYAKTGQDYFDISKDFCNIDVNGDNKPEKVETYRYIDLNYVQIPMMFKYTSARKKKQVVSVHILAGPTLGILSGADMYYEADTAFDGNLVVIPGDSIDYMVPEFYRTAGPQASEDYFSKIDFGFTLDFGADIYLNKNLYVSPALRFYAGLTDINSAATRERRPDIETLDYEGASRNLFGGLMVGIHYMLPSK